jgi:predicted nucleotidyltransferase component of viral defense system
MKYATPEDFRAALEQRLKNNSDRENFTRVRKRVAFERLLARLVVVAPDAWFLKGGFALELRLSNKARATLDIDIDMLSSCSDVTDIMIASSTIDLNDFFNFQFPIEDVTTSVSERRYRAIAFVGERIFEELTIDVGVTSNSTEPTELITVPSSLEFAGIKELSVPAVSLEQHLAEKLHAYTQTYGAGQPSSRPKDLVDIILITDLAEFHSDKLRSVIQALYSDKNIQTVPPMLPLPPSNWRRPYRILSEKIGINSDVDTAYKIAKTFFDPLLSQHSSVKTWNPINRTWH